MNHWKRQSLMLLVSTHVKEGSTKNLISKEYDMIGYKLLRSVKGRLLIHFILKTHKNKELTLSNDTKA